MQIPLRHSAATARKTKCAPEYGQFMFHLVLFEPEIPPNTGNLIRLSANTGATLHLIKPIGFHLDRKSVRRAGLDYDELATVCVHDNFAAARAALSGNWFAIETGSARRHVDARFAAGDVLLFGSERRGLPQEVLGSIAAENVLSLPMLAGNRSLNLSNAAAVAVYEAWRQMNFVGAAKNGLGSS
jgi:tRNA (cytidine(34)-2'-O)-methyltransferase